MVPFQVGDNVVCVDDSCVLDGKIDIIRKGSIYTVRKVGPYKHWQFGEMICVWLEGIRRDDINEPDLPYKAERFRPVKKTDISIFEKMLTKAPEFV